MSGKNPHIPTVVFPIAILMARRLCPGEAAGPKVFFPSGWLQQREGWQCYLLLACFSTVLTQV